MHLTAKYAYCNTNPDLKNVNTMFQADTIFSGNSPAAKSVREWLNPESTPETQANNYLRTLPGEHPELNEFFNNLSVAIANLKIFAEGRQNSELVHPEEAWDNMAETFKAAEDMKVLLDNYNKDTGFDRMKDPGMQALYALLHAAGDAADAFDAIAMEGDREKTEEEIAYVRRAEGEYEADYKKLLEDAEGFNVNILEAAQAKIDFANSVREDVTERKKAEDNAALLDGEAYNYEKKAQASRDEAGKQSELSRGLVAEARSLDEKHTYDMDQDAVAEKELVKELNGLDDEITALKLEIHEINEKIGSDNAFNEKQAKLQAAITEGLSRMPVEIRGAVAENNRRFSEISNILDRMTALDKENEFKGVTVEKAENGFDVHGSSEGKALLDEYRTLLLSQAKGSFLGLGKEAETDKTLSGIFAKNPENPFTALIEDLRERTRILDRESRILMSKDRENYEVIESARTEMVAAGENRKIYQLQRSEKEAELQKVQGKFDKSLEKLTVLREKYNEDGKDKTVEEVRTGISDDYYRGLKQGREVCERSDKLYLQADYFRDRSRLYRLGADVMKARKDFFAKKVHAFSDALLPADRIDKQYKNLRDKTLPLNTMQKNTLVNAELFLAAKDPRKDNIVDRLIAFKSGIDNGKAQGHTDSAEFTRMREALNEAIEMKDSAEFSEKLQALSEAAKGYIDAKAAQWRPAFFSSNMRFTRLSFAENLAKFSGNSIRTLEKAVNDTYIRAFAEETPAKLEKQLEDRISGEQKITKEKFYETMTKRFDEVREKYADPLKDEQIAKLTKETQTLKKEVEEKYGKDHDLEKKVDTSMSTLSQNVSPAEKGALNNFMLNM